MNQHQKEYAQQRAYNIKEGKINALYKKHTTKGQSLNNMQRLALARENKVRLLPKKNIIENNEYNLENIFDYRKHEWDDVLDRKKFDPAEQKVLSDFQALIDQIMLGDTKTIIEALKRFEDS